MFKFLRSPILFALIMIVASGVYFPQAQAKVTDIEKQLITDAFLHSRLAAADIANQQYSSAAAKLDLANGYLSAVLSKVTDNQLLVAVQRNIGTIGSARASLAGQQYQNALTMANLAANDLEASLAAAIARAAGGGGGNTNTGGSTNSTTNSGPTNSGPRANVNSGVGVGGVDYDCSDDSCGLGSLNNPLKAQSVPELITSIIRILLLLIASAAVIMIIVGGFQMVLHNGEPARLAKAKGTVIWAIIGLVVALMSFSIVAIIQSLLQK
jgi:hypothetical protein